MLLNVWYQLHPTAGDRMTSTGPPESTMYPNDGAIAYVPAGAVAGTAPVYRFHHASTGEHRDCTCTSMVGFVLEGAVGYTASSAGAGMGEILTGTSGTDGATYRAADPLAGYTTSGSLGYGYPRYDSAAESILSLSAGGTTVESNLVAGGAVWRWTADGVEYLDQNDDGRLMQAALFFNDSSTGTSTTRHLANPNEAGDVWSADPNPALRHGSPVASASNTSSTTQSTRAIPLEWGQNYSWGGGPHHPVIW